ncbi:MAG: histone deacetylase [Lentisphaeria bacterium]|jgi:acetoin utilization deacetylase AcuC-like enzyme|nr:histone deacetylase [Lentisphaeria bacterium]MDP7740888.1 histone deacetylase [Lentisphaeria bacterium]
MPRIVHSPAYCADIGAHVFQVHKFRRTFERLLADGLLAAGDVAVPEPVTRAEAALVHTEAYLSDLEGAAHTSRTEASELPFSREIIRLFYLAAGGTCAACREALAGGAAINLSGGFHHAFAERAEGFCYLNDVAIGIRCMQAEARIGSAVVVDLDVHQGNGTAKIFADDPAVFTFSMHQERLYPVKQRSSLDVGLEAAVGDAGYLETLARHLPDILEDRRPQLVLYVAGVDPYEHDQLGGLGLSIEGMRQRDEYVICEVRKRGIALAGVLAGGYAVSEDDTVQMHVNTCRAFLDAGGGQR